jgi:hypothetical protein
MAAAIAPVAGSLGIAGAGIGALGSIFGGFATASAANYQAQIARNNAIVANYNATNAALAGQTTAQAVSLKAAAQGGQIKASQAANNIDVNTGSAVAVQKSQRETGELDTLTAMNNAALAAYGYQQQATGFTAQAGLEEAEAAQAPYGGALGASGNLLSNAANIGFKFGGSPPTTEGSP